jgi:(S)-mandelate dehydrogenase
VLAILRAELENTLRLLGRTRIGALDATAVRRRRPIFD